MAKKKIQSVSLQKKLQNVNSCLVNMTLSQMIRGIKDDEFKKKKKPLFTFTYTSYSSVLAWRIPGTGEPGELPSKGSHRVGHD